MKYVIAAGMSIILIVGFIVSLEISLMIREALHREDPKENRKKDYRLMLITWALCTLGIFIATAFGGFIWG